MPVPHPARARVNPADRDAAQLPPPSAGVIGDRERAGASAAFLSPHGHVAANAQIVPSTPPLGLLSATNGLWWTDLDKQSLLKIGSPGRTA